MRIRLDIAYDGTHFRGWALQPGLRTVQGTIEGALARILGGQPRLVVAGRTDAGVHASGQVAHVDLDEEQVARLTSGRGAAVAAQNSFDSVPEGSRSGVSRVGRSDRRSSARRAPCRPRRKPQRRLAARIRGVVGAYSDVAVHRTLARARGVRRALLGGVAAVRVPGRRCDHGLRPARAASHHDRAGASSTRRRWMPRPGR